MVHRISISIWVDEMAQYMQINSKTINKPVNFFKYMNKWTGAIIIYRREAWGWQEICIIIPYFLPLTVKGRFSSTILGFDHKSQSLSHPGANRDPQTKKNSWTIIPWGRSLSRYKAVCLNTLLIFRHKGKKGGEKKLKQWWSWGYWAAQKPMKLRNMCWPGSSCRGCLAVRREQAEVVWDGTVGWLHPACLHCPCPVVWMPGSLQMGSHLQFVKRSQTTPYFTSVAMWHLWLCGTRQGEVFDMQLLEPEELPISETQICSG